MLFIHCAVNADKLIPESFITKICRTISKNNHLFQDFGAFNLNIIAYLKKNFPHACEKVKINLFLLNYFFYKIELS